MRARGWSNGRAQASGAGYGVKIGSADRDRFFDRRWTSVDVELRNETAVVRLSPSFLADVHGAPKHCDRPVDAVRRTRSLAGRRAARSKTGPAWRSSVRADVGKPR
jgi:hypothetical protein